MTVCLLRGYPGVLVILTAAEEKSEIAQWSMTIPSPAWALILSAGAVAWYLNGGLVPLAVLPASSVQLPLTVAAVELGPAKVVDEHEATPENERPETKAVIGLVYHPFELGRRGSPTETLGDEASYENGTLLTITVLPALSVQLPLTVALVESGPE